MMVTEPAIRLYFRNMMLMLTNIFRLTIVNNFFTYCGLFKRNDIVIVVMYQQRRRDTYYIKYQQEIPCYLYIYVLL